MGTEPLPGGPSLFPLPQTWGFLIWPAESAGAALLSGVSPHPETAASSLLRLREAGRAGERRLHPPPSPGSDRSQCGPHARGQSCGRCRWVSCTVTAGVVALVLCRRLCLCNTRDGICRLRVSHASS